MTDENKTETVEGKEKKSGGMKALIKWIILGTVILFTGAAGFGGWQYYQLNLANEKKAKEEPIVQIGDVWPLGCMIVNLMDGDGERYLKTVIQVETTGQECISELDMLKPKIIDNILDLLSSKKYRDIVGFDGKQHLREEISMRLNNYLSKGRVKHVYFTEFVIQ